MSKISKGMVEHLNRVLKENEVGFRYIYENETTFAPTMRIIVDDKRGWVDCSTINCTHEYYEWLEQWFKTNYNITLTYNNTGNIIWSNDYE